MVISLDFKIVFYFFVNSKGILACVLICVYLIGDMDGLICEVSPHTPVPLYLRVSPQIEMASKVRAVIVPV